MFCIIVVILSFSIHYDTIVDMSVYLILLIRETRIRFRAIYFIQKNLVSLETDPIRRQIISQGVESGRRRRGDWLEWNCGKKRKAQNVQRLQIIIPLLFHTKINDKERAFANRSVTKFRPVQDPRGWGMIRARGLIPRLDRKSTMWRAISNYFPNNIVTRRLICAIQAWTGDKRTMPYRELISLTNGSAMGGLEREGEEARSR